MRGKCNSSTFYEIVSLLSSYCEMKEEDMWSAPEWRKREGKRERNDFLREGMRQELEDAEREILLMIMVVKWLAVHELSGERVVHSLISSPLIALPMKPTTHSTDMTFNFLSLSLSRFLFSLCSIFISLTLLSRRSSSSSKKVLEIDVSGRECCVRIVEGSLPLPFLPVTISLSLALFLSLSWALSFSSFHTLLCCWPTIAFGSLSRNAEEEWSFTSIRINLSPSLLLPPELHLSFVAWVVNP